MGAADVAHGGVATRAADPNHRLVVFVDKQFRGSVKQHVPEPHKGKTAQTQSSITSHHFSFGCRMRNTPLPFAHSRNGKTRVHPTNRKMVPSRRTKRGGASGKVRICVQMGAQRAQVVTNPANHAEMLGRVYITHKAMKLAVTFGAPTRDETREVTNSAEQVKPSKAGGIQDFHQHFGRNGLQSALFERNALLRDFFGRAG